MSKTALLLIDLQNDYIPSWEGALWPLSAGDKAASQAAVLLAAFRDKRLPVVHVRHENPMEEAPFFKPNSEGAQIHASLAPQGNEPVVVKQQANSFRDTELKQILDREGVESLVIVGAMSNMCVDAVTRAAADLGYACSVAHDACAAMPLEFGGVAVDAEKVHAAFMGALAFGYARVLPTSALVEELASL
ncbi:cysteine hydrolase [Pseudomaricurvus alkylphenolicus]|uniref:cysteine hydrolase family protein n=1 Tax=Pseudomaricurvus alkylphenolicus TaxID=1306991 RepID=UPI00141F254B|nr:cysteine hydrolase family protein [Pseudomaricurvus alkylphenolicus]NIB40564.1 cysteine hydrolase [Pseudomaricurvus alkylphenolicus]